MVSLLVPIIVDYGSGTPINFIEFILSILLWCVSFFSLALKNYVFNSGHFSIDLYLNITKSEDFGPLKKMITGWIECSLFVCGEIFGEIVHLLPIELSMYDKPLSFLIGSTNMFGGNL